MRRQHHTYAAKLFLALVLGMSLTGCGYNTIVELDQQSQAAWGQVENQLQRRLDVLPNLVRIVQNYATHERDIFTQLAAARAALMQAQSVPEKIAASQQLEMGLRQLLVIVENYPQLKADLTYTRLFDEVAGTENRIAVERMRYNTAVAHYNAYVQSIPAMYTAKIFGFALEKPYFKATEEAYKTPYIELHK